MATPSQGNKIPPPGAPEAGRAKRDPSDAGEEWGWGDEPDDSPFDRATVIPSKPPEDFSTSAVLLRRDSLAAARLPADLSTPAGGARGREAPARTAATSKPGSGFEAARSRHSLDDEVDMWGGGSRVPDDAPPMRDALPTLVEDDPLAFDVGEADDLSLDLDLLRLTPSATPSEHSDAPRGPDTAPYPLNDWQATEQSDSGVHRRSLPQQRHARPTSPPATTLNGLAEPYDELDDGLSLDIVAMRGAETRKGVGSAREPVQPAPPPPASSNPVADMRDRFAVGDFSGALVVAEGILEGDPSQPEAARYAENCRERLRTMYAARLGSLAQVPRVILPPDQVRWLSLDHRAGFVLSCVDGYSTIDEILDVSGMPALDALRILFELLQQHVIAVGLARSGGLAEHGGARGEVVALGRGGRRAGVGRSGDGDRRAGLGAGRRRGGWCFRWQQCRGERRRGGRRRGGPRGRAARRGCGCFLWQR
jgi:hypothetical protein